MPFFKKRNLQEQAYKTMVEGWELAKARNYQESERRLNKSIDMYKRMGDEGHVFEASTYLANMFMISGRLDRAISVLEPLVEQHQSHIHAGLAYLTLGNAYFDLARYDDAVNALKNAAPLAQSPLQEFRVIWLHGRALLEKLDYEAALEKFQIAYANAYGRNDVKAMATTSTLQIHVYYGLRRWHELAFLIEGLIDVMRGLPDEGALEFWLMKQSDAYKQLGRYEEALVVIEELKALPVVHDTVAWEYATQVSSASIYYQLGNNDQALALIEPLLPQLELKDRSFKSDVLSLMGLLKFEEGVYEDAFRYYEQFFDLNKGYAWSAIAKCYMARVYIRLKEFHEADIRLRDAKLIIDEHGADHLLAYWHEAHAELAEGKSDTAQAIEQYEAALGLFRRHEPGHVAEVEANIARLRGG